VRRGASTVRPFRHAWGMFRTVLCLRRRWSRGRYRSEALAALAAQRYWDA